MKDTERKFNFSPITSPRNSMQNLSVESLSSSWMNKNVLFFACLHVEHCAIPAFRIIAPNGASWIHPRFLTLVVNLVSTLESEWHVVNEGENE